MGKTPVGEGWPLARNASCATVLVIPRMSSSAESDSTPAPEIQVPLPMVATFVRQLSHDLRNHLNAAELQSAYLTELAPNTDLKNELKRLREMMSPISASLERLTSLLGAIHLTLMPYRAVEFVEDLQRKLRADYPDESAAIKWNIQASNTTLQIDPQWLQPAVIELFANAFRHDRSNGAISVEARIEKEKFVFTIREPKPNFKGGAEKWGREPFRSIGRGHYGLGLHWSRAVIKAHHGQLRARHDLPAATLVTTVALPLAEPAG